VIHRESAKISERAAKSENEAERAKLGELTEALTRWAKASESAKRIKAALDLARVYLEIALDDLDADPFLLNCANGTIDLHRGELRPHRREDFLTKTTGIVYDATARSELWEHVLERALPDSPVREFLQRCAGYTALGCKGEDVILVAHGQTRTAKGTVQGAIAAALGEYGETAGLEALAERDRMDGSRPRPELVKLRGARMVNIYETGRELRLNDALVKSLAGSDEIAVRDLHKPEIRFRPTFLFWIATNYRPRIRDDDDAIWARIREVPFTVQIPKAERDPTVRARLSDPADAGPAVLRWIVEGAIAYQRDGLVSPDRVSAATAEYREEMDPLHDFLAECCVLSPQAWTKSSELRDAYEAWVREVGGKPIDSKEWAASLRRHNCQPKPRDAGRGWLGIALLGPATMTP
jgi:putative DNA primase/helicase